jgi:hypothetical protein
VAAVSALAAALGGEAGAPGWLRIVLGGLALGIAVVVVGLTVIEQTAEPRGRERRWRGWVEQHFGPRGRGVARSQEAGEYFTGRQQALRDLVAWLAADAGGLCVVTGDPGSGKSAVLGRIVALARRAGEREVADVPADTVPSKGDVDVAVWAKGLTMPDVVEVIAANVGVPADGPDELIGAVLERKRALVVVVDALDEASGEGEGRRVAQRLLKPLAAAGRDAGVKVLVGTRRGAADELLAALGADKRVIDLDAPAYFEHEDLVQYVRRRLLAQGERDARTPYSGQPALAERVACAVANRASPSFLIGYLVSGALRRASQVVDTGERGWETQFAADVGSAMDDYLDRFAQESDRRRARDLLTVLAFAEGAGLPNSHDQTLWPRVAGALANRTYNAYDGGDVDWMLHTAAADLVDQTATEGTTVYRLFPRGAQRAPARLGR